MAEVLEEGLIIRIVLAVVMWSGIWHIQIDEFETLTICRFFDFAFSGFDDAGDGFHVWIQGSGGVGRNRERKNG